MNWRLNFPGTGMAALLSIVLCATALADNNESLKDLFMKGTPKADVGLNFRSTWEDRNDDKDDEGHLGWFYAELGYETPAFHGVKIGGSFLYTPEAWGTDIYEDEFSDDGHFYTDNRLKYLYANIAIPKTQTELLIGRKKFKKVALMDGDVHEGAQLTIGDIPKTKLYIGLITAWEDDVSQSWDLDGVEDFTRQMDDTVDRGTNAAGDIVYTCIADISVIDNHVMLTPFIVHHPDYLTTYGALAEANLAVHDVVTLSIDGGWARYAEDTRFADDEDAETWKIHTSAKFSKCYVGVGYFRVSDDPDGVFQGANAGKTIGNYHWEPIKVHGVGLYCGGKGGDPDDSTVWVDAGFSAGKFSLDLVYGNSSYTHGEKGHEQDSQELDVIGTYEITSACSASLGFISQNFKDNEEVDRNFLVGGMKYKFF